MGGLALIFTIWLGLFGGIYPHIFHFRNVSKIVIRVTDINENDNWPNPVHRRTERVIGGEWVFYERILTAPEDIDEFVNVLGVTWDGIIDTNSHELSTGPRCNIEVVQDDGSTVSFIYNHREWGRCGVTPKRMVDYMVRIMR